MDLSILSTTINEMDSIISTQNNDDSELKLEAPKNTFPTDVLKWMKKNAKPQMALKLMQICKYFQHQEFPYFVIATLTTYYTNEIVYNYLNDDYDEWDTIEDIPNNLWITQEIKTHACQESHYISQLIPKISVCEVKKLEFMADKIFFNDFQALTSAGTVRELHCYDTYIRDKTNQIAPFEDVLACLPNIEIIFFRKYAPSFSTAESAKKEWILPNLKLIEFQNLDENFNAETFIEFMRKHKTVQFILCIFSLTFQYAPQLRSFVDEIISAADLRYPPPHIEFTFHNIESTNALRALEKAYAKK